jgi:methyltransferase (TIGR00027 family)
MSSGELSGVSRTAIGVALIRARESRRPDRLFNDPFAARFVAAAPDYIAEMAARASGRSVPSPMGTALAAHVAVRTRFYDTYLLGACAQGCRQVALLAAGLDARAYRLDFPPGVRLFELDLPPVLTFKQRVLDAHTPTCERIRVPVDLSTAWADTLCGAGFDPAVPTAWLIEGLLIYLTRDEAVALLETVNGLSAPGSEVSFEQSVATRTPGAVDRWRATGQLADVVALWKGGLGEDAVAFLARRGWQARSVDRKATAESYGREDPGQNTGEFILATKGSP